MRRFIISAGYGGRLHGDELGSVDLTARMPALVWTGWKATDQIENAGYP